MSRIAPANAAPSAAARPPANAAPAAAARRPSNAAPFAAARRRPRTAGTEDPAPAERAAALFALPFGELAAGDRFTTPARAIQERDILDFAALSGDRHPQHTDPEWAEGSRFGEQIAHGLLVLSLAVGLMPLDPDRVVALRRVSDAVFKQPVKIGDIVHVEGDIVRTRQLDDEQGLVEARLRIVNADGRLAVRASIELVWRA